MEKKLEQSLDVMQSQSDRTNSLLEGEAARTSLLEGEAAHIASDAARIAIDEAFSIMKEKGVPVEEDLGMTGESTSEVERLKVTIIRIYILYKCFLFSLIQHFISTNLQELLKSEKKRANNMERRYAEALKSVEGKRMKLEETEIKVHQLQESLNRYHNS